MQRAAVALTLAVLLGLAVSFGLSLAQGSIVIEQSDLVVYHSAAHLILTGHAVDVYHFSAIREVEASLLPSLAHSDGVMPYLYPPYFALALAPLGVLPFLAAYLLWLIVDAVILGLVLAALTRYAGISGWTGTLFCTASISWLPVFIALAQGQVSILILGLFTACLLALRGERDVLAGVFLAFALVKVPLVIPVLIVLLVRRRWLTLVSFTTTTVSLALVPLPVMGWGASTGFVHTMMDATHWRSTQGGFAPGLNHTLAALATLLLPDPWAIIVRVGLSLAAVSILVIVSKRSVTIDSPFAVAVVVALLISPHVLLHDLTLLLLPAAVALRAGRPRERILLWILGIGYVAVMAGLRLVHVVPIQWSVVIMATLVVWFVMNMRPSQSGPVPKIPPKSGTPSRFDFGTF